MASTGVSRLGSFLSFFGLYVLGVFRQNTAAFEQQAVMDLFILDRIKDGRMDVGPLKTT
ncbi:MAG: hypothetical protein VX715_12335 [Planctomycetota bacterium]|nr:hypothetical protein [Planctomycetota bacterium]